MISRLLLEDVLAAAMSTGADFAEAYAEKTRNNGIRFLDGKIDTVSDDMVSGVGIRAFIGYKKALKAYGGAMKPSTVTFEKEIVSETPNGIMKMPYDKVKTIHFLKHSFVIEDDKGVGILVSKRGFGDADFMDCVNFLCEKCSNLEL